MISLSSMVMRPMTIMNRRSTGVTRTTRKRLTEVLPQYEADDGALTKSHLNQVKKAAPKAKAGTVCSNLFDMESA